ncbi:uncharacterized protein FFB20_07831 [Fusarium fujikuroi]|uniref:Uncharacterized protein n=1 Tax=Fusarium fujikuroi TaxID=5127 RepID=A0A2H3SB51_FUSFU|nr:uncharacterized protein LW94_11588 [Fusarium fujikuroi]KLP08159.1 uncharacterized protein Y057_11702 [Fusarium fujikuroi]QGI61761.1 hypothetical protein CEK27_005732 [Fusarium fujikuroi]QGI78947.1 hypothetical protein CEK25_005676 [Fusarium fujikuroi]QGI92660.1 hypothetical protein CEK26_005729 [Fusarium fujikuroi]
MAEEAEADRYMDELWGICLQRFMVDALSCPRNTYPTVHHIGKLFENLAHMLPREKLSTGMIQSGFHHIVRWANASFEGWVLTESDVEALNAKIQYLVEHQVAINDDHDVDGERLLVSMNLAATLIRILLQQSIDDGAISWDSTLQVLLSIALISATGAKAGDMSQHRCHQGNKCLCWEHISISWKPETGRLEAVISFKFCHRFKQDPDVNLTVTLQEIQDPSIGYPCPINILLVWALRTGAVRQTSMKQLHDYIVNHPDNNKIWCRPTDPVLCSSSVGSGVLNFDTPIQLRSLQNLFKTLTKTVGLMEKGELDSGSRSQLELADGYPHKQISKRTRNSRGDVLRLCQELGLNPGDRKERDRASKELRKRNELGHHPINLSSAHGGTNTLYDPTPIDPNNEAILNDSMIDRNRHAENDAITDKWLLQQLETGCVHGMARATHLLSNPTVLGKRSGTFFHGDIQAMFILLSRINEYRYQHDDDEALPSTARHGGSRAEPTRFRYLCKEDGCDTTRSTLKEMNSHVLKYHGAGSD